jgi:hypothetical protein
MLEINPNEPKMIEVKAMRSRHDGIVGNERAGAADGARAATVANVEKCSRGRMVHSRCAKAHYEGLEIGWLRGRYAPAYREPMEGVSRRMRFAINGDHDRGVDGHVTTAQEFSTSSVLFEVCTDELTF